MLTAEITERADEAGNDLHLYDDDEPFEVEYVADVAAADAMLARYGYRRTADWRWTGSVAVADIAPIS